MKGAGSHDVTHDVAGRELTIVEFLRALHRNRDQMRQGHNQVRQHPVWDSRGKARRARRAPRHRSWRLSVTVSSGGNRTRQNAVVGQMAQTTVISAPRYCPESPCDARR